MVFEVHDSVLRGDSKWRQKLEHLVQPIVVCENWREEGPACGYVIADVADVR